MAASDSRSHLPNESSPKTSRSLRVSPKGQVTVPKPVRDHLGLTPGSAVEFELTASGEVLLRKRPDSARPLRGLLSGFAPETAPTVGEIDAGIAREVARLDAASRSGAAGSDAGDFESEAEDE